MVGKQTLWVYLNVFRTSFAMGSNLNWVARECKKIFFLPKRQSLYSKIKCWTTGPSADSTQWEDRYPWRQKISLQMLFEGIGKLSVKSKINFPLLSGHIWTSWHSVALTKLKRSRDHLQLNIKEKIWIIQDHYFSNCEKEEEFLAQIIKKDTEIRDNTYFEYVYLLLHGCVSFYVYRTLVFKVQKQ